MIKSVLMAGGLALCAAAASAATISGDSFTMFGSISDIGVDFPSVTGTALGTAGAACRTYDSYDNCDAVSEYNEGFSQNILMVDFTSNSAFEIGLLAPSSGGASSAVEVLISGLDFMNGSLTSAITGVTFNPRSGYLSTFLRSPENPDGADWYDPAISFTDNSITIRWDFFDGKLFGDGPSIAFDVTTAGTSPAPVPLPATAPFLLAGLAAIGLLRRRRN